MNRHSAALFVAIDDAVSMPTVLLDLICRYAVVRSYEFTCVGIPGVSKLLVCHPISESKNQIVEDFGPSLSTCHRLVSTVDIGNGPRSWTIKSSYHDRVWIGVTKTAANACGKVLEEMISDCSMIGVYNESVRLFRGSMMTSSYINFRPILDRPTVHFDADPSTRQITATIQNERIVVTTAATDDEFWRIRPCVVVAESFKLTITSID